MRLKITFRYILAFIALNFVMGELHEQAHIQAGYLLCGCYGERDFNVWATCDHCESYWTFLAALAGPVFSCSLMWLGARWMLRSVDAGRRMLGFALLFANLPFARIFTALTGHGDEQKVMAALFPGMDPLLIHWITALLVLFICLPPIVIAARVLASRNRIALVTCFSIVPLIDGLYYHHIFLNWLLKKGIASGTLLLGTPSLVLLHFLLMLLLWIAFRNHLSGRVEPGRSQSPIPGLTEQNSSPNCFSGFVLN
ncbi:MAG TPA: hypothetical protein VK666_28430 [Chryseolinea sp.]|nr:hypothetical protein [Chryseolinea sp.]